MVDQLAKDLMDKLKVEELVKRNQELQTRNQELNEKSEELLESLKQAEEKTKENLGRIEKLEITRQLGGRADVGIDPTPRKISDVEFANSFLKGKVNLKDEIKDNI